MPPLDHYYAGSLVEFLVFASDYSWGSHCTATMIICSFPSWSDIQTVHLKTSFEILYNFSDVSVETPKK